MLHHAQPGRVFFLQQKIVGLFRVAVFGEHVQKERRTQKPGAEGKIEFFQKLQEVRRDGFLLFRLRKPKLQKEDASRHGVRGRKAAFYEPLPKRPADLRKQRLIGTHVLAKPPAAGDELLRGMIKVGGTDKVLIRKRVPGIRPVQGQPVAVVVAADPQIFLRPVRVHEIHPAAHAGELLPQGLSVPVDLIELIGDGHHRIAPGRGKPQIITVVVRRKGPHSAVFFLLQRHVLKPLAEKCRHIIIVCRRPAEQGRVSQPAVALVSLGAVRGHLHEVGTLCPQNALIKLLDIHIFTGKPAGLFHIRIYRHGSETAKKRFHLLPAGRIRF